MIVKKIEANTMSAALNRAKEIFGSNAKIHDTATLPNGKFQIIASAKKVQSKPISRKREEPTEFFKNNSYVEEFVSETISIKEIKTDIQNLQSYISQHMNDFTETLSHASWGMESKTNPSIPDVLGMLLKNGIPYENSIELSVNLPRQVDEAISVIKRRLVDRVSFGYDFKPGIHAFAGPTGCGKTSIMIKLALELNKGTDNNVCMVVGDATSPGAYEELMSIGCILGVDVYSNHDEVPRSLYTHVLLDNPSMTITLKDQVNIHLVVSSSLRPELYTKLDTANFNNISSVVITKVDEIDTVGTPLLLSKKFSAPISLINNSSDITEKLISAGEYEVCKYIKLAGSKEEAAINRIAGSAQ